MSLFKRRFLFAAASLAAFAGTAAQAETLADALALAYQSNPTLQSQRALQRQTDETYVQARAAIRPTLNASSTTSYSETPNTATGRITTRNATGVTLSAAQPLFTGGRASAAIDVAEANVLAGRETLRTTEQTVMQSVVQAYQDVLRDQQIVAIRQQSLQVLSNQLDETRARFEVGLLTRTDVARAEAQVASSRAQLATAQSALQNSRAAYATAVGRNPGELQAPQPLPGLPANVDEAFKAADDANPALSRARIAERASRFRVAQVRAQRNPTVSLQSSYGFSGTVDPFGAFDHNLTISGVVSQPLFTGGSVTSQIRAALEQNNSDRVLIEQSRRAAVQSVAQAWNLMQAAATSVTANQEQVRAATVAFEGAQEQYRVGLSTTLDVLLTQETLRSAQLALAQAQRDLYVNQASLLAAMGRLDGESLLKGVELYDPARNFDRVKGSGAVPWEGIVEALDGVAPPAAADPARPIPAPALSTQPSLAGTGAAPAPGEFATTVPTQSPTAAP